MSYRFERWRDAIQAAASPEALGQVMREYVRMVPPTLAGLLPPECQRALANTDLQDAAITLLHCELTYRGDPALADLLHEIAHTYAAASTRIARLAKDPYPRAPGTRSSGENAPGA